ncbi:MAG: hypothetical protein IT348_04675, partial [Candidatus Eisenbacteria bacterium]|nr:hypothetical protein [Candidatus Eisenbacteria bacterium]
SLGALTLVVERAWGFGGDARSEGAPSRNRDTGLNGRAGEAGPPSRYRPDSNEAARAATAGA